MPPLLFQEDISDGGALLLVKTRNTDYSAMMACVLTWVPVTPTIVMIFFVIMIDVRGWNWYLKVGV